MTCEIHIGCTAPFGQGGLGYHLQFISEAAHEGNREHPHVYCIGPAQGARFHPVRQEPPWMFLYHYSPLRWSPALKGRAHEHDFDRIVQTHLPQMPVVYHSFPGCAENSFKKVHKYGGTAILEAATTHANSLCQQVEFEHSTLRMGGNPFSDSWRRQVLREYELADYIVVSSVLQEQSFIERGYPASKIIRVPLGIDTSRFSPASEQSGVKARESGEKFRIIQVGQVSLLKGFHYTLEALKRLNDPQIELLLFGGIGWRGIRRMIDRYRQDGVNVVQRSGDPVSWMRSSHICVHPSVQDGFGLAPLEAMSCGLPLIVTETTGLKEAVEDGSNGYVMNSRDVGQMAEYIQFLKKNEDVRIKMARKARTTALGYDATEAKIKYANALGRVWNSRLSSVTIGGNGVCQA